MAAVYNFKLFMIRNNKKKSETTIIQDYVL